MELADHRREVKEIDELIVGLIEKRLCLAGLILEAKISQSIAICDPEQEEKVLDRAADLAIYRDIDPGAVREIFNILIRMSRERQQELLGDRKGDQGNSPCQM